MKLVFRADASAQIGSGHVMRCLCLANATRDRGGSATFISRNLPPQLSAIMKECGHDLIEIDTPAGDVAADAAFTLTHLSDTDWLVVDHYGLDLSWEAEVRTKVRVLAIDDLARAHDCDLLLDQNYAPDGITRYAGLVPQGTDILIGPRYALLRPEFRLSRPARKHFGGTVEKIVVFVGGMDADDITSCVLDGLCLIPGLKADIDVIIGVSHPNRAGIEAFCARDERFRCHVQVTNMADFFASADLVIGSGGSATWERCVVGAPTIALCIADNQRDVLRHGSKLGLVYAPDIAPENSAAIARHVQALIENSALREIISRTGMTHVDGRGVDRVVARLEAQQIVMRRAEDTDCEQVHLWRNHSLIRSVSKDAAVIPFEKHQAWFAQMLQSDTQHLLIGERGNQPIGVVRFDLDGSIAVVSIYLIPDILGSGLGAGLLSAAESWLRMAYPDIASIRADVRSDNHASCRLFEFAGYVQKMSNYFKDLTL